MAVTIGRTAWTDDDGSGTTGTVLNNAAKTAIYDQIDTALALLLPLAGGTLSGVLTISHATALGSILNCTATNGGYFEVQKSGTAVIDVGSAKGIGIASLTALDGCVFANAILALSGTTSVNIYKLTTLVATFATGMIIGAPTGGDKGAGTLNATAVYDDNVLLTDWVLDLAYDGKTDQPMPDGGRLFPLDETRSVTRIDRRLPWMPARADFEQERSLGRMVSSLWFGQEQQQLYIQEIETRLRALEPAA